MNTEDIVALATILVAVGGTLAPVIFWVIQRVVKPFVSDTKLMPIIALAIGALVGLGVPFLLEAFGMASIPWIGSVIAGMVGGAIAMKTYDEGVNEGIQKTEGEE